MGKPWLLHKVTGVGDSGSSHASRTSFSIKNTMSDRKSRKIDGDRHIPPPPHPSSSSGCMSAIFHMFHTHNRRFHFHQSSFNSETFIIHQQPSNILKEFKEEKEVHEEGASISSSKLNQETNFNIYIKSGIENIKTKSSRFVEDNVSSESCCSSPSTKSPNLVARLMGLDLIPDYSTSSPRSSLTNSPRPSCSPLNPIVSRLSKKKEQRRDEFLVVNKTKANDKSRNHDHQGKYYYKYYKNMNSPIILSSSSEAIASSGWRECPQDEGSRHLPRQQNGTKNVKKKGCKEKEKILRKRESGEQEHRPFPCGTDQNFLPNESPQRALRSALATRNGKYDRRRKKMDPKKVNTTTKFLSLKKDLGSSTILPKKQVPKPYITLKPLALGGRISHRMCDIDVLIEGDTRRDGRVNGFEAEEVVREIECEIVEMLVNEIVIEII